MLGYVTLVSLLYSIFICIFKIIFTLVSVVFLYPFMDFNNLLAVHVYVQDGGTR